MSDSPAIDEQAQCVAARVDAEAVGFDPITIISILIQVLPMLASRYTVMIGVSDMPNVKPREYSLEQLKKDLRV